MEIEHDGALKARKASTSTKREMKPLVKLTRLFPHPVWRDSSLRHSTRT